MKLESNKIQSGEATYCPEDDKLRLYVGRVPRAEYEALRAEGWTSTPKQSCDFVAVWTPDREDTALAYGEGYIGDEDQDPGDRAADRAERFAGYHGKRTAEALTHADTYEDGPTVHGYQDPTRAERAAARHDRTADRALTQWSKAEYWQRRTAGVIHNALYKDLPGVRMGRIKRLETEKRKMEKSWIESTKTAQHRFDVIQSIVDHAEGRAEKVKAGAGVQWSLHYVLKHDNGDTPSDAPATPEQIRRAAICSALDGYGLSDKTKALRKEAETGARPAVEIARDWLTKNTRPADWTPEENRWAKHYALRLAYENQMLAEQGGRLEQKDIEPGGKIGGKLILKVNKSPATKRATSVHLLGPRVDGWSYKTTNIPGTEWAEYLFDTERLSPDAYTPPTDATLAELAEVKKTIAAARKQTMPKAPPLINPTPEDAEKLQALINTRRARRGWSGDEEPLAVAPMTQADYSASSKGTYSRCETADFCAGGERPTRSNMWSSAKEDHNRRIGAVLCKLRIFHNRVVILTDKPQKPLPVSVVTPLPEPAAPVNA